MVPRFELDTPRVNSEAPIGLIKKTSTSPSSSGRATVAENVTPKSPKSKAKRFTETETETERETETETEIETDGDDRPDRQTDRQGF